VAPSALVVVGYFVVGVVAFWSVLPGISGHLFTVYQDLTQSAWFVAWVPHALGHGLNPFFSGALDVPAGVNLQANTASPLLGLITEPLALVFSLVVRVNLLMVVAMPLSASAAYAVLRRWQVWVPGAALGGLVYGFSPYMVGHSLAHISLTFLPLPPLMAWTVVCMVRGQWSPWWSGVLLGLLVTGQYLISPEVLAIVAVLIVVVGVFMAICHPSDIRGMVGGLVGPLAVAAGVAGALLAYPVWMMVAGPQHTTGSPWPLINPYHNDVLSLVVPGPLQRVSLGMRSLGVRLIAASNPVEATGYIGIPVLIVVGIFAWRSRRSRRMQAALVVLVAAVVLSLGPHLTFNGDVTGFPLPFWLLDHLPLFKDILPDRIGLATGAGLGAVAAFGLDDLRRPSFLIHRRRADRPMGVTRPRGAVLATVTLAVLVVTQLPQWPYVARPTTTVPGALRRGIPGGDPIALTYPYPTGFHDDAMLWQAEEGFKFRLLGGYAFHPKARGSANFDPGSMSPIGLQEFLAGQEDDLEYGPVLAVSPSLVATTRATLRRYHVRLVIVDRSANGSGAVTRLFDNTLGRPRISAGTFSMWTPRMTDDGPLTASP
jgi:hypothetical protein